MSNTLITQETKWYYKTPFVIFVCIMFFPLGLFLLWKSKNIKTGWKTALTVIFGLYGLMLMIATFTPDTPEMKAHKRQMDSLATIEQSINDGIETQKKQKEITKKRQMDSLATIEQSVNDSIEIQKKQKEITEKRQKEIEAANKAEQSKEPRLVNSVDELKQRFNDFAVNNGLDFHIYDITIETGDVKNTFQYNFNENITWIGTLNKSDNSINEIAMIANGDGTLLSGTNIVAMMLSIIEIADPSIKSKEGMKILTRFGFFNKHKRITDMQHIIQNGIDYWIDVNPVTGFSFGAKNSGK